MNEPNPVILVDVGHALYEPWKSILYQGQLETWAKVPLADVRHSHATPVPKFIRRLDLILWKLKWRPVIGKYFSILEIIAKIPLRMSRGNLQESLLPQTDKPSLMLKYPDLNMLMNFKSFSVITGTLIYNYDFLVSTTSSSYLNIEKLKDEIAKLPRNNIVAGRILRQGKLEFASGSFRIFSRDVVEEFLINRKSYSKWRPEDLAFGHLAAHARMDLTYIEMKSIDIDSIECLTSIPIEELANTTHFRLKSGSFEDRADISIMHELHKRLNETH